MHQRDQSHDHRHRNVSRSRDCYNVALSLSGVSKKRAGCEGSRWELKKHAKRTDDEKVMSNVSRRWEEMDHDILVSIMKRLNMPILLMSACCVCKSWLNASIDTLFPPGPVCDLATSLYYVRQSFLRTRFLNLALLYLNRDTTKLCTKVVIPQWFGMRGYKLIAKRVPAITNLEIQSTYNSRKLDLLSSCWNELEEIYCCTTCLESVCYFWNNQIRKLRLNGQLMEEHAHLIANNFPNLTHLSIGCCCGVVDSYVSIILQGQKNLVCFITKLVKFVGWPNY